MYSGRERKKMTEVTFSSRTAGCKNSERPEIPVSTFAATRRELDLEMKTAERKTDQGKEQAGGSLDPVMPEASTGP